MTATLTPDLWAAVEAARRARDSHAHLTAHFLLAGLTEPARAEAEMYRADGLEANALAREARAQTRAQRAARGIGGAS